MLILVAGSVFMIAISILVHELGHLVCGKMVGVNARIFSFGYGKGIWKKRIGNTIYQITAIPIGGYVQFKGDNYFKKRQGKPDELLSIHPLKRIIPVIGGPFFNLLLGFLIFFLIGLGGSSQPSNRIYIDSGSEIYSQAYKAGIRSGDTIIRVNGAAITNFEDLIIAVSLTRGESLNITYIREKQEHTVVVHPDVSDSRPTIGVSPFGERRVVVTFTYMEQIKNWFVSRFAASENSAAISTGAIGYLKDGDVILQVEGTDVYSVADLQSILGKYQNKSVNISVDRKKYPLLTPWSGYNVTVAVPVKPANIIHFYDLKNSVKGYQSESFSLADYDPDVANQLQNIKINGRKYSTIGEIISQFQGNENTVSLQIGNLEYTGYIRVKPIGLLGFRPSLKFSPELSESSGGVFSALEFAFSNIYKNVSLSVRALGMILGGWIAPSQAMSGPVGIFEAAGISLEYGWNTYFDFLAKISIALMFMNLLPLPLVDGGHILLYLIEAVTGRPLPPRVIDIIFRLGFVFLISLGLMVTYFDIMRIFR